MTRPSQVVETRFLKPRSGAVRPVRVSRPRSSPLAGAFALLPLLLPFASGCASGGSGPPVSGEAASSLFASYSGRWELDESTSTPQIPNQLEGVPDETPTADISRNESREMRRYRRMIESRRVSVAHMRTTIEVLRRRPATLILSLDESGLVYTPIPGRTLNVPLDGSEVEMREGEHRVRTSLEWERRMLSLRHQVVSGGSVRERLEVVGDRLIMTRTMANTEQALVLAFDRS